MKRVYGVGYAMEAVSKVTDNFKRVVMRGFMNGIIANFRCCDERDGACSCVVCNRNIKDFCPLEGKNKDANTICDLYKDGRNVLSLCRETVQNG